MLAESAGPAFWSREDQVLVEMRNVNGNNHTDVIKFPLRSGQRDILPGFVVDIK